MHKRLSQESVAHAFTSGIGAPGIRWLSDENVRCVLLIQASAASSSFSSRWTNDRTALVHDNGLYEHNFVDLASYAQRKRSGMCGSRS
jgi:hypothetical protein